MENFTVGELKAKFSEVLKRVAAGEEIGIAFGKKKTIVARLVPRENPKSVKRKIGLLEGKAKAKFSANFKMTEEEFIGS